MTAAITAAHAGLRTVVVEKAPVIGGTTASSGGEIWIPCSHHSKGLGQQVGESDTIEKARAYVQSQAGSAFDAARVDAYLAHGPAMVEYIESKTALRFEAVFGPDYHPEEPGSSNIRALATVPYNTRHIAGQIANLKGPLPQTLFLGLALGSFRELKYFMSALRSLTAFAYVSRRMVRHFADVALHGRGRRMVRGHALMGRLLKTATDLDIPIVCNAAARSLLFEGGRVAGAVLDTSEGPKTVRARRAVILASGGFPRSAELRRRHYPSVIADLDPVTPVPMENTGDGARMAQAIGARFDGAALQPAAWTPTSRLPNATDFTGVWPHLVDRNQPGYLMILSDGRRFANEGTNYHSFVAEMLKSFGERHCRSAWMIGDHRALRRWGLGFVRPAPVPYRQFVKSGYLLRARSVAELAGKIAVDPKVLSETVETFNGYARAGIDRDFHRGESSYDRYFADPSHKPNSSLAPLETPPFYAVQIYPGEIGTFSGLATDEHARVLNSENMPIAGLYAVGNDQASVFGGSYPGAGATIGPAMVFGWLAARHIAEAAEQDANGKPLE